MIADAPGTSLRCADCGTDVAAGLRACPHCHRLVHRERLKQLAGEAQTAASSGDLRAELLAWRESLPLLPAGSRQHEVVAARIAALSDRVTDGRDLPGQAPTGAAGKWIAALGGFGLLLWKFKFLLALVVTKGKLLLLGLTKASTVFSMLLSLGVYWTQWGIWFALGIIVSIYVHEMGHVAALHRYGFPASAPMFIPGLGAVVRLRHRPASAREDARIGLAGPMWGLGAAIAAAVMFAWTRNPYWGAIARTGAWLNLFNLLPVWQLDGGRAFAALSASQRRLIVLVIAAAWLMTGEGLLVLLLIAAAVRAWGGAAPAESDQGALVTYIFLVIVLTALSRISVGTAL
jgi:Zn-dependent protease